MHRIRVENRERNKQNGKKNAFHSQDYRKNLKLNLIIAVLQHMREEKIF